MTIFMQHKGAEHLIQHLYCNINQPSIQHKFPVTVSQQQQRDQAINNTSAKGAACCSACIPSSHSPPGLVSSRAGQQKRDDMKLVRTIAGMLVASALLCAGNLCINASKDHGKIPYISVTVTFLIEVFKLVLCLLVIVCTNERVPENFSVKESLFYAVPSLLYMIDNNLTYVILRFVDPATLSVLWNIKILTTAVLFRFVLKRELSEIRKIAIVLLLLGVVTSQSDHLKKESVVKTARVDPAEGGVHKDDLAGPENFMFGAILVLVAVTISSCASVFTEWAFKRKGSCSFLWQNVQLYVYGILFNGFGLLVEASEIRESGFFSGYNNWTFAVIFVNCIGGICMGFILKYLDNIACVYSHAIAMMLTMFFSMLFFQFSPSLEFGCGLSVLLISMYLYHHKIDTSATTYDSDEQETSSCHQPQSHKQDNAKNSKSILIESIASGNPVVLANGLHLKKKHYEKVPDDSDLELASPVSSTLTGRSSTSHLMSD